MGPGRGCRAVPSQPAQKHSCRLRLLSNSDSRQGLHGGRGTKLPVRLSDTQRAESPPHSDRPVANAGEPEPTSLSVPCCTLLVCPLVPVRLGVVSRVPIPDLSRGIGPGRPAPGPARAGRSGSDWLHDTSVTLACQCIINWQALAGTQNREPAGSGAPVAPPPALRGAAPCRRRL